MRTVVLLVIIAALLSVAVLIAAFMLIKTIIYIAKNKSQSGASKKEKPRNPEDNFLKDFADLSGKNASSSKAFDLENMQDNENMTVGINISNYSFSAQDTSQRTGVASDGLKVEETVMMYDNDVSTERRIVTLKYMENDVTKVVTMKKDTLTIGRGPENDVIIKTDKYLGQNHAVLLFKDDKLYLKDLNSKNHSYVNGSKVSSEELIIENAQLTLAATKIDIVFGN